MQELKFKPGDKVKHPDHNLVFTIVQQLPKLSSNSSLVADYKVSYYHNLGTGIKYFNESELTLYKEEEMTQQVEEKPAPKYKIGDYVLADQHGVRKFLVFSYDETKEYKYLIQADDNKAFSIRCNEAYLSAYPIPKPETTVDECRELLKQYCLRRIKGAAICGEWTKEFQLPNKKAEMIKLYLEENGFAVKSEPSAIETTYTKLTVIW